LHQLDIDSSLDQQPTVRRLSDLIQEEKNNDLKLRVYITGGGCSGFSYGFTFDDKQKEGDSGVAN
jgi:iron-sulfur cluster insertion protein